MQEAVLRIRLYKDIDLHNELLNKINSLPRSYKAEYLRNCLLLGDSVLRGQNPLPAYTQPVNQPLAQAPQQAVPARPVSEVQQVATITPPSSSLAHEKDAEDYSSSDEDEAMDAFDSLAKLKNKFKKGD